MAFPKSTSVPIASSSRSEHDLTCQHITTSDFLQFQVSKCIEIVKGQSVDIEHECFSRLAPMPVPTFGRGNIVHRAFFVPMRTIFPSWNDFITDTPHYFSTSNTTSIVPHILTIDNNRLIQAFKHSDFSTVVENEQSSDILYTYYVSPAAAPEPSEPQVTAEYRKFTALGRFAYKLLRSLGISPVWSELVTEPISLMPIFACIRIYYDYFYPSQYINDEDSSYFIALLSRDVEPSSFVMDITGIQRIFKILYNVPYGADYFTSAWDNPTGPSQNYFSNIEIHDTTLDGAEPANMPNSTYVGKTVVESNGTPSIAGGITQFALNSLRALSDYMKRHQIAGSRALDRYLARFGVKLSSEQLNRCIMLNEYSQELQFGDVFSTSDTAGARLGDYAGKGLSYGQNKVTFNSEQDYGFLIIVSCIMPTVQYYQGQHRSSRHISRLDFFTPEFDNLGTQAISLDEVYVPTTDTLFVDGSYTQKVFGFTPRYAEYKIPYSQITGDLVLNSQATTYQRWTLFRDIKPLVEFNFLNGHTLEHSKNFVMATDKEQYDRIFYNTDDSADHFTIIHNFKIKSSFPGKSLYNDYQFENEDKAPKVTLQVNGTTAN